MRHKADWKTYLAEVQALPPSPERLRRALIWAVCTVRAPVTRSERDFDALMRGQQPSGYLRERRERAIGDVEALIAGLDFEHWRRRPLAARIETIVRAVHGLGYAKTSFALTCAGLAEVPCLDVWALRERLGVETRSWRDARAYLRDCDRAFGRRGARKQWAFYWHLRNSAGRAFRRTSHAIVFYHLGVASARLAVASQGRLFE